MFDDSADYVALGNAIATGHDYCTPGGLYASRMPGYPVLIAGIDLVFGAGSHAVYALLVLQALMGTASCYLVYRLARPMSEMAAILAALLAACDPLSIAFSAAVLTEILFTFLMLLALFLVERVSWERISWRTMLLLGGVLAGAIYLRASFLPLAFLLLLVPVVRRWRGRQGQDAPGTFAFDQLAPSVLASVVVVLLLAPWVIRNRMTPATRGIVLTSIEGTSLYEAVYPAADGGPRQDKITLPPEMRSLSEGERNHEWSRRAWHEVFSHPGHVLALVPIKIARTWSPWFNAEGYRQPLVQTLLSLWHIPLYALALTAIIVPRLRKKLNVCILLPVFYFTMLHALYLGSVRYRVPVMPLVDILAAVALAELWQKVSQPQLDKRV